MDEKKNHGKYTGALVRESFLVKCLWVSKDLMNVKDLGKGIVEHSRQRKEPVQRL